MRVSMVAFTNIEYTIELSEALSEKTELMLMIPKRQAERFRQVISPRVNIFPFTQSRLRYPSNLLHVFNMYSKINNFNPDVIHIQKGDPWFNFFLPFFHKYCIITTVHDVELHTGDKESSRIPKFTHNIALRYADQVIVHGQELKTQMIRKTNKPLDYVNVLPRGINSIYTRYSDSSIETDSNMILFFGRIWEYKGLKYLIEAEPLVSAVIPRIKIVIAGRGQNIEDYRKIMVNEDKFITYNQHIPNEMVAELFQKASIVVLPYTDASQSGVVPLAYAFRKPVIVTNVGSLPEIVDDGVTGIIIPPKNSEKLAEAILELLNNNGKRERMGEAGFNKGMKELSWKAIADNTIKVYNKAISIKSQSV